MYHFVDRLIWSSTSEKLYFRHEKFTIAYNHNILTIINNSLQIIGLFFFFFSKELFLCQK